MHGFLTAPEIEPWKTQLARLRDERRVVFHDGLWVAVERSAEFERAMGGELEALVEILRSRLELVGPVTEATLAGVINLPAAQIRAGLLALEAQGSVMRGRFSGGREEEWCERRLLIRIHRYTRDRKRNEIQTVPPAQFMRFLFRWQRVAMEGRDDRREGEAGLLAVLQELEGFAVPAGAWERDILPLRVKNYVPQDLDKLCAAGRIAWYRPVETSAERDSRRRPGRYVVRQLLWSSGRRWRIGRSAVRSRIPPKDFRRARRRSWKACASMAPRSSMTSCTTRGSCGAT